MQEGGVGGRRGEHPGHAKMRVSKDMVEEMGLWQKSFPTSEDDR